jgi:hypothetical protein
MGETPYFFFQVNLPGQQSEMDPAVRRIGSRAGVTVPGWVNDRTNFDYLGQQCLRSLYPGDVS